MRLAGVGGTGFRHWRVLELVGFESDGAKLTMPREKVDQNLLNLVGGEITGAMNNPFFGKL